MMQVDILMCTFRRPAVVDALRSLDAQEVPGDVQLRIIVADNDETPSARDVVEAAAATMTTPVHYVHAPARNISIARNACLDAATGDWVAFIDDDETAPPAWISNLMAQSDGVDAVFGPAIAQYGDDAPAWMAAQNVHSNIPERRGDTVETGHTCNALLRWRGAAWQDQRFDLARGKTGGEDTEFFFRIRQMGAQFAIAEDAIVTEDVAQSRMRTSWVLQRKYRMGQSYAAAATSTAGRIKLGVLALAKMLFSAVMGILTLWSEEKRMFWLMRAALHLGVISGCLSLKQPEIYGHG